MTPELKNSCEVVFQEHKTSANPVTWNKDPFRGRMSIGLCELAKDTLVKKNIIYFPKPAKKTVTLLNPVIAGAATFEEAVVMAQNKVPSLITETTEQPSYSETSASEFIRYTDRRESRLVDHTGNEMTVTAGEKWYLKPLFYYVVWPFTALVASVLIAYIMSQSVAMMYR